MAFRQKNKLKKIKKSKKKSVISKPIEENNIVGFRAIKDTKDIEHIVKSSWDTIEEIAKDVSKNSYREHPQPRDVARIIYSTGLELGYIVGKEIHQEAMTLLLKTHHEDFQILGYTVHHKDGQYQLIPPAHRTYLRKSC